MGASVVAVLAVAGTGLVVAGGSEGEPKSRVASGPAAVGGDSTSPSTSPRPVAEPSTPGGKEPVSAQEIARVLLQVQWLGGKTVEPQGLSFTPKPGDSTSRIGASAGVMLKGVKSSTRLAVQVTSRTSLSVPACAEVGKFDTCTPFTGPGGARGYSAESMGSRESTAGGNGQPGSGVQGPWTRSVRLQRTDGVEITVTETAERGVVGAAVPADVLPLPLERLMEVALLPTWQLWVDPEVNRAASKQVAEFQDQSVTLGLPDTVPYGRPQTERPPAAPTGTQPPTR
ncbi:hypothetical protein [Embleya sp. NPDC059259]|uniref:hypothetical protein n=1 Tax=unclassified Embleya TaxID=2699296 RepID=UPI003691EB49